MPQITPDPGIPLLSYHGPILPVGGHDAQAAFAVFGHQEHALALQAEERARLEVGDAADAAAVIVFEPRPGAA